MVTWATHSFEWNAICQVCRFKHKASDLRKRWDGLWVCEEDWEMRHPLDFYRTRNDTHQLPFVLPDDAEGVQSNGQGLRNMLIGGFLVGSKMLG